VKLLKHDPTLSVVSVAIGRARGSSDANIDSIFWQELGERVRADFSAQAEYCRKSSVTNAIDFLMPIPEVDDSLGQ
jgi:hypothetical protein